MTSAIPFEPGCIYVRTKLLGFVGSRQLRSGIIWGQAEPGVVICTSGGRHAAEAGYEDKPKEDGTWDYFGQGSTGDHDPHKYANRMLVEAQRSILFFRTKESSTAAARIAGSQRKSYRFIGEFCVGGWEFRVPTEGPRKGNRLICFNLMPASAAGSLETDAARAVEATPGPRTLHGLRARVMADGKLPAGTSLRLTEYRARSSRLRDYARLRADGKCEHCNNPAPFLLANGDPFLEVHHIFRLADDGPDEPENVAGLCPNCHRMAHHGPNKTRMRDELYRRMKEIERAITRASIT